MGSDVLVVPELGVALLVDSATDLEDELPTPDGSPSTDAVKPGEVVLPEVCPAPRGGVDLELVQALLEVAVLPMIVTPIMDPVRGVVSDSGFVPGASHSCTVCERACPCVGICARPGPCVSGFFPSGDGWKPGSG